MSEPYNQAEIKHILTQIDDAAIDAEIYAKDGAYDAAEQNLAKAAVMITTAQQALRALLLTEVGDEPR